MRPRDPFKAYDQVLAQQDLAPASREAYRLRLRAFKAWLAERPPTAALAANYVAWLRGKGYAPGTQQLAYHALRGFHAFQGEELRLKLRKPQTLQQYWDAATVERLIAHSSLTCQPTL
jgi:site-specific recombinase XerD